MPSTWTHVTYHAVVDRMEASANNAHNIYQLPEGPREDAAQSVDEDEPPLLSAQHALPLPVLGSWRMVTRRRRSGRKRMRHRMPIFSLSCILLEEGAPPVSGEEGAH